MRALLVQSPIAALAAVCISAPAVAPTDNTASAAPDHNGVAYTVAAKATNDPGLEPDLTLVLAPTGNDAEVGSGVLTARTTNLELIAVPKSIADSLTSGQTDTVPSVFVEAGRTAAAKVVSDLNASASAAVTTSPTLFDVLQHPLQTLWQIGAGVNVPSSPLIPTPYTSLITATNAVLQVSLLPLTVLNLALYGHIEDIPSTITNTLSSSATTLFDGLPESVIGTLKYDASVLHQFFGGLGGSMLTASAETTKAASTSALAAAEPAAPSLLDVLQLPLQTAWAIGAGVNVPSSPLIPKPYTSVLKATSDVIQVGILPLTVLNLALFGHIENIPSTITSTLGTATTSLFQGLPASITGTLKYDASVVHQFVGDLGTTPANASTTESSQAKAAALAGSSKTQDVKDVKHVDGSVTESAGSEEHSGTKADPSTTGDDKKHETKNRTDGPTSTGTTGDTNTGGAKSASHTTSKHARSFHKAHGSGHK